MTGGFPVDFRDWAKQLDGLVNQVGAEVVKYPSALSQQGCVPPVPEPLRPPPLEAGFKRADFPKLSVANQLLEGKEITIPSAVLEHGQAPTGVSRRGNELFTIFRARDERFVDNDVQTAFEGCLGQLFVVEGRCADNDHIQGQLPFINPGKQFLWGGNDAGLRIACPGSTSPSWV